MHIVGAFRPPPPCSPPLIVCSHILPDSTQWSVAVKDTIDEFVEAAKAAAMANAGKSESSGDKGGLDEQFAAKVTVGDTGAGEEGAEGDFDDFDFDGMDESYRAAELPCVEASIDILRVFRRCLKAANDSLNSLDSPEPQGESGAAAGSVGEAWLQGKLEWAKSVQTHLDDANECAGEVGILLYPPLDGGELSGRANDLEKSLSAFCEVFCACGEGQNSDMESPLRKAVVEKLGVLRAALEKL